MGTSWSAQLVVPAGTTGLQAGLRSVFDTVVAQMSHWDLGSNLCRFNRAPVGDWVPLPAALLTVLAAGLRVAAASAGAFDPAIADLVDHWGFGPDGQTGAPATVAAPWRALACTATHARRTANVRLDLSGIAKGYAVDAAADWLHAQGVHNFLIEAGGELRGAGVKPDAQPWWVDLEAIPGLQTAPTRIALCGLAAATSGDYRRYRLSGARRDSHSIDPATGAPIRNNVAAVTVFHSSAMFADAFATAITVLGPDAGLAFATRERLAAIITKRTPAGASQTHSPAFAAMLD